MLTFISKLQRKPEHVRQKIAVGVSAILTGIIALLWLVSLGSSLAEPVSGTALDEEEMGPLKALTDSFGDFFADTAETLQTAAGAFSGFSAGTGTVENTASDTPDSE
ncbi:MAG: hypothetical protein AAB891_02300 [Patescibacteria group bacterium]